MDTLSTRIVEALPTLPTILKRFVKGAFAPNVRIAALSIPRGNGKSYLAGRIAALFLDPVNNLGSETNEIIVVSGSLEQSRVVFQFIKEAIKEAGKEKDYRFLDSSQRLWIEHKASGYRVRAIASSGKRAMGLATFSLIVADEPSSWAENDGRLLWDAVRQSLGKRRNARVLIIGTLSPSEPASWFPELVKSGTNKKTGVFVMNLSADPEADWQDWKTVESVNPMMKLNKTLRDTIRQEHQEAIENPYFKNSFCAFRLNQLVETRKEMLVKVADWLEVEKRDVPPRKGQPIIGLDMGSHRSWSAVWCIWESGRSEAYAVCGSIPSLRQREKQDSVPKGLYEKLHAEGTLFVDEGVRVARPQTLVDKLILLGIEPSAIFCDRFLLESLKDVLPPEWPIEERKTRWSEASEDICGFRKLVADGPLSIVPECRTLAKFALSQSIVIEDEGNLRISKKRKWRSRDDVSVCASLACGALVRHLQRKPEEIFMRCTII